MDDKFIESLIGKYEEEALEIISSSKFTYRIIRRDNTNYIVTHDFRLDRLNLEIDNKKITTISIG